MTETETVQTAYGDVEIELEECDSCGTRVPTDETVPFEIGDRTGVACEVCRDEGPVSFPPTPKGADWPWWKVVLLFAGAAPLATGISLLVSLDRSADDELIVMYLSGIAGSLVWLTIGYVSAVSVGALTPL